MTKIWHRLDPLLHLAAAIGWAVGLLTLLTAALTATFVLWQTRGDLEADSAALFASETSRLADTIGTALQDKLRTISASASLLDAADRSLPDAYVDRLTQAEGKSRIDHRDEKDPDGEQVQLTLPEQYLCVLQVQVTDVDDQDQHLDHPESRIPHGDVKTAEPVSDHRPVGSTRGARPQ
jgi:hypothetical protein